MGDAQAVLAHVLDMLGPGIDEGDVFAGLHHMGAGISADRAGSDDCNPAAHAVLSRERGRIVGGGSIANVLAVIQVMEKLPVVATRATRLSSPKVFSAAA